MKKYLVITYNTYSGFDEKQDFDKFDTANAYARMYLQIGYTGTAVVSGKTLKVAYGADKE